MIFTPVLASFLTGLLTTLFVIVCIFLILVILIQKPRGGGLTGAFGGAGGNAASVFGSKTGDVLTWFTVICFALFIGLAMALTWTAKPTRVNVITPVVAPPAPTGAGDGTVDGIDGVKPAKDFSATPEPEKKNGTPIEPAPKDGTTPAPVPAPAPTPAKDATTPAPAPVPAPTPDTPAKDAK